MHLIEVVGPTGGDALTAVTVGDQIVVPTDSGIFVTTKERWQEQPGLGLNSIDPAAAVAGLVQDGAQMNYPRRSMIARHQDALWIISRLEGDVALLYSDDLGTRWSAVDLPNSGSLRKDDREDEQPERPIPSIEAAEPPQLQTGYGTLYLVGTDNVWKFSGTPDEPNWRSIGLEGLPLATGEGLPPAIRNYLPRAAGRPFELLTVLADQLLIYRRSEVDDPWVITSTMAVVDRQLAALPDSETVFLVSPDSIQRSDDQGERWFGFWPAGHPRIEAFALMRSGEHRFDLLVGGANGSIWRSDDAGATWKQTRPTDPDQRAVTGLLVQDQRIWATTLGSGVLMSADGGQTWGPRNAGLRATQPLDVAFTNDGEILLASRAGLVQLTGEPESGNWVVIDERATSAVSVAPVSNRIVSGSINGALSTRAEEGEPSESPTPFGDEEQFEFSPHQLPRSALPPVAVVSVNPRDDGRRWLAWSHLRGGVKSDDGGIGWTDLELTDGLRAALGATTVRQVVAEASDTIYLLEDNRDTRTPALLWRSEDDGATWTTVHAFPRERASRVIVRARPPNYPGVLFAAHGDQFMRSEDSGSTWTTIEGPWKGSRIIGLALAENHAALLLDARRHLEIAVVEDLEMPHGAEVSRHVVMPADDVQIATETITRFELYDRRVLITSKRKVWTGTIPQARRALGDGLAFLATLAGAVLLIAIAFVYMRSAVTAGGRH